MSREAHDQRHIFWGEVNGLEYAEDICYTWQGGAIAEDLLALSNSIKEPQLMVVGSITTYSSDIEILTIVGHCLCVLSAPDRFADRKIRYRL